MSTSTALSTARSRRRRRSPSPSSPSSSSSAPPPQRPLPPPPVARFMTRAAQDRWEIIQHRSLAVEPALSPATLAEDDVMAILRTSGMLPLLDPVGPCFGNTVREFVCHIHTGITDPLSGFYHTVHFRSREIAFSPSVINEVLSTPDDGLTVFDFDLAEVADELTGGEFADWPHDTGLHTLSLSFKYATLHRALRARVLPTIDILSVNPRVGCILFAIGSGIQVNFGHLMFHDFCDLACSSDVMLPVIFPCLITRILSTDPTVIPLADTLTPPAAGLHIPPLPLTVRTCLKAELVALRNQVAALHQREASIRHHLQTQPLEPWP